MSPRHVASSCYAAAKAPERLRGAMVARVFPTAVGVCRRVRGQGCGFEFHRGFIRFLLVFVNLGTSFHLYLGMARF